jgi:hypothetical protein
MEHLGAAADRNAAKAARQATLKVWNRIKSKLGTLDYYAALDHLTKKEHDESISDIVQKDIIAPFSK